MVPLCTGYATCFQLVRLGTALATLFGIAGHFDGGTVDGLAQRLQLHFQPDSTTLFGNLGGWHDNCNSDFSDDRVYHRLAKRGFIMDSEYYYLRMISLQNYLAECAEKKIPAKDVADDLKIFYAMTVLYYEKKREESKEKIA